MPVLAITLPGLGFEIPLEITVIGVVTGLTYSILAVGLVLVYRSSRVVNFAHGEMGALAASLVPVFVILHDLNYGLALVMALVVGGVAGAATEFVVMRRLSNAPRLIVLVATIGVSQFLFAVGAFVPKGDELGAAVYPVPFDISVTVGTLRLTAGRLLILAVVPLVTLALVAFFRWTKVGLAARAAAENRDAARLVGIPVKRVSLVIWLIAGLTAAVAGILSGPTRPLVQTDAALGPGLLLRALAAAMLGGMTSLPWAFGGGIIVGVTEVLLRWNFETGGAAEMGLFVLIVGSLALRRGLGRIGRGGEGSSWSLAGTIRDLDPRLALAPAVRRVRVVTPLVLLAAAAVVPVFLGNADRVLITGMAVFALIGLSLTVLTGYAGQVSLGQFAFVALGAVVGGRMLQLGYPHWMGLLYAVVVGGAVALLVGLPALRIRGLFLAVATLGFAVAADAWMYQQDWLVHVEGGQSSLQLNRPELFSGSLEYYWLSLGVLTVVALGVRHLKGTGVGRAMQAVRDNEPAAAALSVSPRRAKLTAFVLSGMIAALGGYLYGGLLVNFNDTDAFSPALSLVLMAQVVLGGVTHVTGAIAGAVFLRGLGQVVEPLLPFLLGSAVAFLVAGLGLLVVVLQFPGGLTGEIFRLRDRLAHRLTGTTREELDRSARDQGLPRPHLEPRAAEDAEEPAGAAAPAIEAEDIVLAFGGNVAVDGASIRADHGEIVGMVGPNGAGKTSLFDVLSGQLAPDRGTVRLFGEDVTWLRPEQRALRGLGRTFQQADLFGSLRVDEVFKVALEGTERSEVVPSLFALPPALAAERRKQLRAHELVELLGMEPYVHLRASELSTGMRRIVELGTVVALGARVLLLDEPTAGIAQREVEAFRPVLSEIRDHLGATVVVIEHDIPLISGLVDRLYVLSAGRVIAEGPPSVLREDPEVIATYIGTDETAIRRSGETTVANATDTR